MSALSKYFDKDLDISSPIQKDFSRKVLYDDEGNEFVTFEEVDYPAFQKSLGSIREWSLDSLLKAGINPNFSIHTGSPTRLAGLSELDAINSYADSVLAESAGDAE